MIKLYVRFECPFCQKVMNRLKELNLKEGKDLEIIDGSEGAKGREVILKVGGKSQVPFMVDDDINVYESDDIIKYIEKKFSNS